MKNILSYELTQTQAKKSLKKCWLLLCKTPLIINIIILLLSLYFIIVSIITAEYDATIMGISSFCLFILITIYLFRCYQILRTQIIGSFNFFNECGIKKYELNKEDNDVYEIININNQTNFKFLKNQIKSIKKDKDFLLIVLKNRSYFILPNTKEIRAEFLSDKKE